MFRNVSWRGLCIRPSYARFVRSPMNAPFFPKQAIGKAGDVAHVDAPQTRPPLRFAFMRSPVVAKTMAASSDSGGIPSDHVGTDPPQPDHSYLDGLESDEALGASFSSTE